MAFPYMRPRDGVVIAALVCAALLAGCSGHPLMPTPNLYAQAGSYPQHDVPPGLRDASAEVLYLTDRAPTPDEETGTGYGFGRSASVGFGVATVRIGQSASWPELARASASVERGRELDVHTVTLRELGRFPPTPHPFKVEAGEIVEDESTLRSDAKAIEAFRSALRRRLDATGRKEVFMYVHGYNNTFADATHALAEMWHFIGRGGVPVVYSWPAARGGLLGYFADRESGEFTVYHLKQALRMLASFEEIDRIHILAHSRGTDVTTTALRELVIESRAAGLNPLQHLRIANLVLAAPDLDFDIVRQRLIAEKFGPAIGQITIYSSPGDQALAASTALFGSVVRFGLLTDTNLDESEQAIFRAVGNVTIIEVPDANDFFGHGYFRSSPAASSDLILVLRDGLKPGEPGRPLTHVAHNFWRMDETYPALGAP